MRTLCSCIRQCLCFCGVSKLVTLAAILVSMTTQLAWAQDSFPTKEVTLIVPFAAGGPTDIVARAISTSMSRAIHQQIVVENVIGSGGTTASLRAKRSPPDGYTIMLGHMGTHAAASAFNSNLPYDPIGDFEPIGLVVSMPVLILAKTAFPADSLTTFIEFARGHSQELTMAHAGAGSVSFATCEFFNKLLDLQPRSMAFQGTAPAIAAMGAGRVDYMCDQIVNVVPQVNAGAVKAFAVAATIRNSTLPDVPTSAEAGLPEFRVDAWNALFAPKGTPILVVRKLNAALSAALDDEVTRKQITVLGGSIPNRESRSSEYLHSMVEREIAKWGSIATSASVVR